MGLITKNDLNYQYSWTSTKGDDPKISGEPDKTLLNRNEGYEILYFINKFCEMHSLKQKNSALKIEKIIKNDLPSAIRSQENIKDFMYNNWTKYNY